MARGCGQLADLRIGEHDLIRGTVSHLLQPGPSFPMHPLAHRPEGVELGAGVVVAPLRVVPIRPHAADPVGDLPQVLRSVAGPVSEDRAKVIPLGAERFGRDEMLVGGVDGELLAGVAVGGVAEIVERVGLGLEGVADLVAPASAPSVIPCAFNPWSGRSVRRKMLMSSRERDHLSMATSSRGGLSPPRRLEGVD